MPLKRNYRLVKSCRWNTLAMTTYRERFASRASIKKTVAMSYQPWSSCRWSDESPPAHDYTWHSVWKTMISCCSQLWYTALAIVFHCRVHVMHHQSCTRHLHIRCRRHYHRPLRNVQSYKNCNSPQHFAVSWPVLSQCSLQHTTNDACV